MTRKSTIFRFATLLAIAACGLFAPALLKAQTL